MGEKLTFETLWTLANSGDERERKRAYAIFRAWEKTAPQLRMTHLQRTILQQLFAQKGFNASNQQRRQ